MKFTDFPLLKYSNIILCVMTTTVFSFPQVLCGKLRCSFSSVVGRTYFMI